MNSNLSLDILCRPCITVLVNEAVNKIDYIKYNLECKSTLPPIWSIMMCGGRDCAVFISTAMHSLYRKETDRAMDSSEKLYKGANLQHFAIKTHADSFI